MSTKATRRERRVEKQEKFRHVLVNAAILTTCNEKGRVVVTYENAQFVVGWGTLSLINAGLAQAKGRSGLLWWLISLLLGPVATFLIVILPRVEQEF
ncbi:MAG: hypothetical protein N2595_02265 [bacterium]|nr:hypothetical protein [bacterium]